MSEPPNKKVFQPADTIYTHLHQKIIPPGFLNPTKQGSTNMYEIDRAYTIREEVKN